MWSITHDISRERRPSLGERVARASGYIVDPTILRNASIVLAFNALNGVSIGMLHRQHGDVADGKMSFRVETLEVGESEVIGYDGI